ncbi:MAG: ABC transporter permease subunit [Actinomycetota bacterium]
MLAPALVFLGPALLILVALVVYPIVATVIFSFQDRTGDGFVGLANYREMLTNSRILTAIRNNVIWVLVVPPVVTGIGLVFAVLTERITFGRAFKTIVFMPMAISLVAGGVIWRVVYEDDPDKGLLNAGVRAVGAIFSAPGAYVGAGPSEGLREDEGALVLADPVPAGSTVEIGLLRLGASDIPEGARPASVTQPADGAISGAVFRDFTPGEEGTRGELDAGEIGLPGVAVELRDAAGEVVARSTTDERGRFDVPSLPPGSYQVGLAASNFRAPFSGIEWLGPALVTPAIIAAYTWIWAGFAMVVIAAGLAAIPREVLEAARVDGAKEWQTFRYITVPLLAPVIAVVLITLVIYVLKVFDIVLVIAPSNVQDDANVIALEMYQTAFGARNLGLGSAVAVLLFLLVVPFMAINIRRFRAEQG